MKISGLVRIFQQLLQKFSLSFAQKGICERDEDPRGIDEMVTKNKSMAVQGLLADIHVWFFFKLWSHSSRPNNTNDTVLWETVTLAHAETKL